LKERVASFLRWLADWISPQKPANFEVSITWDTKKLNGHIQKITRDELKHNMNRIRLHGLDGRNCHEAKR